MTGRGIGASKNPQWKRHPCKFNLGHGPSMLSGHAGHNREKYQVCSTCRPQQRSALALKGAHPAGAKCRRYTNHGTLWLVLCSPRHVLTEGGRDRGRWASADTGPLRSHQLGTESSGCLHGARHGDRRWELGVQKVAANKRSNILSMGGLNNPPLYYILLCPNIYRCLWGDDEYAQGGNKQCCSQHRIWLFFVMSGSAAAEEFDANPSQGSPV